MDQKKYIISALIGVLLIASIYFLIQKLYLGKSNEVEKVMPENYTHESSLSDSSISLGKILFQRNCSSCHNIYKDMTGPPLLGVDERWPDKRKLYQFIRNPSAFIQKNEYLKKMYEKYGIAHLAYPTLTDAEINAILQYITIESEMKKIPVP